MKNSELKNSSIDQLNSIADGLKADIVALIREDATKIAGLRKQKRRQLSRVKTICVQNKSR